MPLGEEFKHLRGRVWALEWDWSIFLFYQDQLHVAPRRIPRGHWARDAPTVHSRCAGSGSLGASLEETAVRLAPKPYARNTKHLTAA